MGTLPLIYVFLTPNSVIACKGEGAKHICLCSYEKENAWMGIYLILFLCYFCRSFRCYVWERIALLKGHLLV